MKKIPLFLTLIALKHAVQEYHHNTNQLRICPAPSGEPNGNQDSSNKTSPLDLYKIDPATKRPH